MDETKSAKDVPQKPIDQEFMTTSKPVDVNLNNPTPRVSGIRLNIGSGVDYKEGFLNVDPFDADADLSAPADKLPFKDNSVAQILCYETLEHVGFHEVLPVLKEFHRVLKKDGQVILTVPDMVSACERFLKDPEDDWALARIYGHQGHPGQFHKTGFTPKRLFKLCGFAGFRLVNIANFKEANGVGNLYCEAIK